MLRDGGRFALGIVAGFCGALLIAVFLDVFGVKISSDRAIIGAIIGGFVAGLATLLAALVGSYLTFQEASKERSQRLEAEAYALLARIHTIRDISTKAYRHYYDASPEHNLFFPPDKRLPKPLLNSFMGVSLSDSDRAFSLVMGDAELFNRILDAEALAKSFDFHQGLYESKFNSLYDGIFENSDLEYEGYFVSGDAVVNKRRLMEAENARDLLQSLLRRAPREVDETHRLLLDLIEKNFRKVLRYKEFDTPPQSPNDFHPGG